MTAPTWMIPPGTHEVARQRIEREYARRERRTGGRTLFRSPFQPRIVK